MNKFYRLILGFAAATLGAIFSGSQMARADWTANIGYHNPVIATYGLNLLYFGQSIGFEVGLGWIDVKSETSKDSSSDSSTDSSSKKTNTSLHLAGDLDLKYFFTSGKVRPYVQGGVAYGIGASTNNGASAGTGGGFAGLGLLFGGPPLYAYAAYNFDSSRDGFVQVGLGTSL